MIESINKLKQAEKENAVKVAQAKDRLEELARQWTILDVELQTAKVMNDTKRVKAAETRRSEIKAEKDKLQNEIAALDLKALAQKALEDCIKEAQRVRKQYQSDHEKLRELQQGYMAQLQIFGGRFAEYDETRANAAYAAEILGEQNPIAGQLGRVNIGELALDSNWIGAVLNGKLKSTPLEQAARANEKARAFQEKQAQQRAATA